MTRHVPYEEFTKDPAKYMDEAGDGPLYVDRAKGSVVILSRDEYESREARRRSSARSLLAAVAALPPIDEGLPPIPDPVPGPVEL